VKFFISGDGLMFINSYARPRGNHFFGPVQYIYFTSPTRLGKSHVFYLVHCQELLFFVTVTPILIAVLLSLALQYVGCITNN